MIFSKLGNTIHRLYFVQRLFGRLQEVPILRISFTPYQSHWRFACEVTKASSFMLELEVLTVYFRYCNSWPIFFRSGSSLVIVSNFIMFDPNRMHQDGSSIMSSCLDRTHYWIFSDSYQSVRVILKRKSEWLITYSFLWSRKVRIEHLPTSTYTSPSPISL